MIGAPIAVAMSSSLGASSGMPLPERNAKAAIIATTTASPVTTRTRLVKLCSLQDRFEVGD